MKTSTLFLVGFAILFASCERTNKVEPGTYVDLNSGDSIQVIADPVTGYAINSETQKPVYLYVNNNRDTIFTTGAVVNNKIVRVNDDYFEVDDTKVTVDVDDEDVTIKYADYKKKFDGDDYKVKGEDYKLKVEGDGDSKLKNGDYKKKVDEDGDVKIKDGDSKIKIEDGEVKRKN